MTTLTFASVSSGSIYFTLIFILHPFSYLLDVPLL
nr:MAG TPA: hypothetical protein [Caudoviricetes sp.]